jgi:hypothetical protein
MGRVSTTSTSQPVSTACITIILHDAAKLPCCMHLRSCCPLVPSLIPLACVPPTRLSAKSFHRGSGGGVVMAGCRTRVAGRHLTLPVSVAPQQQPQRGVVNEMIRRCQRYMCLLGDDCRTGDMCWHGTRGAA